jgi:hypothetical protein
MNKNYRHDAVHVPMQSRAAELQLQHCRSALSLSTACRLTLAREGLSMKHGVHRDTNELYNANNAQQALIVHCTGKQNWRRMQVGWRRTRRLPIIFRASSFIFCKQVHTVHTSLTLYSFPLTSSTG